MELQDVLTDLAGRYKTANGLVVTRDDAAWCAAFSAREDVRAPMQCEQHQLPTTMLDAPCLPGMLEYVSLSSRLVFGEARY